MENALTLVKQATFARGQEASDAAHSLLALPVLHQPTFVLRALEILLSRPQEWDEKSDPRDAVLSEIYSSISLMPDSKDFRKTALHHKIGELLHRLLERIVPVKQARVLEIVQAGYFWSPSYLPFFITQIEAGNSAEFLLPIYEIGLELDHDSRERLKRSLSRVRPATPPVYSLLFLLNLDSPEQKADLIRMLAQHYYWIRHSSYRRHFPIGIFASNLNMQDAEFYLAGRKDRLSDAAQITGAALTTLHHAFHQGNEAVIRAMAEAQKNPGMNPVHTSEFFLKLTTTGFASVSIHKRIPVTKTKEPATVISLRSDTVRPADCEKNLE